MDGGFNLLIILIGSITKSCVYPWIAFWTATTRVDDDKQKRLCSQQTYVALQLVGLLGVLDVELLGVAGVVVELVAVDHVAGLSLVPLCLQELGLIGVDFVVGTLLLGLALVLQVALQFAGRQGVHHLGVVLHAAQPHLLALLLQVGVFVEELQELESSFTYMYRLVVSLTSFFMVF